MVPDIHHWPGISNPADLGTRGVAVQWQVEKGSVWQEGPAELGFARDRWPATREFRRQLPREELLIKTVVLTDVAPKERDLRDQDSRAGCLGLLSGVNNRQWPQVLKADAC